MFVLQEWVRDVGCKMQSILLSGFRAPDQNTVAVKKCVRWLRAQCQINADPAKQSYMKDIEMTSDVIDAAMDEAEYLPVHYVHHLADSFAVLAYHHPDRGVKNLAIYLHYQVAVELFHFKPECEKEFMLRHRDKFVAEQGTPDTNKRCVSCMAKQELFTCGGCGCAVCKACLYTEGCKICAFSGRRQ